MDKLTVPALIEAGVHFGCRHSRWNPKMAPYIHGRRGAIHVIDLRETMRGLIRARNLLFNIASEGQTVLWVGTKRQVKGVIQDAGERTGMPVVTERWIGGTLTNFSVIRSRLRRLEQLEAIDEKAVADQKLTKKELATINREKRKITRNLGGIREMNGMPGAMLVVDPSREGNAVREARKMGIVVIGLLDTDCDPSHVDIVIPGNDDALKSVRLLVDQLISAVEEGWHQHTDRVQTMGIAEKAPEAAAGDEPRPSRPSRPLPPKKDGEGEAADAGSSEADASATSDAATADAAAPETKAADAPAAPEAPVPSSETQSEGSSPTAPTAGE